MGGLFLLGGLASSLTLIVPMLLVLGLLVILALRNDDDGEGNRSAAIYGSMIWLVGTLTVLAAVTGVVTSLVSLADEGDFGDDAAISGAMLFLIVGLAAAGLLYLHRRLFVVLADAGGAAARVRRAHLLVMCLITAIVAMVAAAVGLYQLYGAAFPDTAGADRGDALQGFVTALALFAAAGAMWQWHWRRLDLPGVTAAVAP